MKRCPSCGSGYVAGERCHRCKFVAPSQAQIRRACLRIQKGWSPGMRRQRQAAAYRPRQVEVEVVHDPHPEIFGI